jgi:hypothetical protein
MGFSSFPSLNKENGCLPPQIPQMQHFQNLDLLYDVHADFVNRSLGANARFVVFHVDEVDRSVCCARQASDIAE